MRFVSWITNGTRASSFYSLDGDVDGREGGELILDGQRVQFDSRVKLKGHGPGFAAIPPGHEEGRRFE